MMAVSSFLRSICVLFMVALLGAGSQVGADSQDTWEWEEPVYARVSALDGTLAVRGPEEEGWSDAGLNGLVADGDTLTTGRGSFAEIEVPGSAFLRLGGSAALDVLAAREGRYRLLSGSAYLVVRDRAEGALTVEAPSCGLVLVGDAEARMDVDETGGATVYALSGEVQVLGAGQGTVDLQPNMRLVVNPAGGFSALGVISGVLADELAQWHAKREAYLAERALPPAVPPGIVGGHELSGGEWVTESEVVYWRPPVEPDWRPYSVGVWHHYQPVGWYWVPRLSFEYVTCHYGYWRHSRRHGWLWRPTWVWRPARVYWAHDDVGVYWAPLDYHRRPVFGVSPGLSVSLSIGDGHSALSFGWWSYATLDDFCHYVPRYTVIKRKTVIKGDVIHVDRAIGYRNRRGITIAKPAFVLRGRRRKHDHDHDRFVDSVNRRRHLHDGDRYRARLKERLSDSLSRKIAARRRHRDDLDAIFAGYSRRDRDNGGASSREGRSAAALSDERDRRRTVTEYRRTSERVTRAAERRRDHDSISERLERARARLRDDGDRSAGASDSERDHRITLGRGRERASDVAPDDSSDRLDHLRERLARLRESRGDSERRSDRPEIGREEGRSSFRADDTRERLRRMEEDRRGDRDRRSFDADDLRDRLREIGRSRGGEDIIRSREERDRPSSRSDDLRRRLEELRESRERAESERERRSRVTVPELRTPDPLERSGDASSDRSNRLDVLKRLEDRRREREDRRSESRDALRKLLESRARSSSRRESPGGSLRARLRESGDEDTSSRIERLREEVRERISSRSRRSRR